MVRVFLIIHTEKILQLEVRATIILEKEKFGIFDKLKTK